MTNIQLDLGPATEAMKAISGGITDDQLSAPTPCAEFTAGAVLHHVVTLTDAFTLAARKQPLPGEVPESSAASLDPRWRETLPGMLDGLARAWREPAAWEGEATVAGVTMPGSMVAMVVVDELVVHAWDLARATGQNYSPDEASVAAAFGFAEMSASDEGTPGLFGPQITVPADAPMLDRLLGLTGRDPAWRP